MAYCPWMVYACKHEEKSSLLWSHKTHYSISSEKLNKQKWTETKYKSRKNELSTFLQLKDNIDLNVFLYLMSHITCKSCIIDFLSSSPTIHQSNPVELNKKGTNQTAGRWLGGCGVNQRSDPEGSKVSCPIGHVVYRSHRGQNWAKLNFIPQDTNLIFNIWIKTHQVCGFCFRYFTAFLNSLTSTTKI